MSIEDVRPMPELDEAIVKGFLEASNLARFRFCIFYDSTGLGYTKEKGIVFDIATKDLFVASMAKIARTYFGHPSYLRVHGRPVVVLYLTRTMRGLLAPAMEEMRAALRTEGYDPFVIGDEIFWIIAQASDDPAAPLIMTGEPQVSRIRLFDAITAYNLYDSMRIQDRGYGATSRFVPEAAMLYRPLPEGGKGTDRPHSGAGVQRSRSATGCRSLRDSPPMGAGRCRRLLLR
jgi:hypothetical protein